MIYRCPQCRYENSHIGQACQLNLPHRFPTPPPCSAWVSRRLCSFPTPIGKFTLIKIKYTFWMKNLFISLITSLQRQFLSMKWIYRGLTIHYVLPCTLTCFVNVHHCSTWDSSLLFLFFQYCHYSLMKCSMDTDPIINKRLAFFWVLANIKHCLKLPKAKIKINKIK